MTKLAHLFQDLQTVTADLHQVNSRAGLLRFTLLGFVFLSLVTLAWLTPNELLFGGASILAGFFYAFWLICTHDMVHQTLTGWTWFDTLMARLITWPMLWPYGVYAQLHHLHHGWNGINLQDPERVQWTIQEYQQANFLQKWYVRHQWSVDIFVFGGIGLIVKTFINGVCFQNSVPRLRQELWLDSTGMLIFHSLMLTFVIIQHQLLHYLLLWLVLERVIGVVVQTRDHLEHYGLWGKWGNYQLTQLYTCRNLNTSSLAGWLMGGLNYHVVHHAFPNIPFNQLPEAFERIQEVLQQHGLSPMQLEAGYLKQTLRLSRHPLLIAQKNSLITTGNTRWNGSANQHETIELARLQHESD